MTSQSFLAFPGVRFRAAALALAAGLFLAGCAGSAPADPGTGTTTPTASASASATPTPTASPTAAYKPADASGPAQNVPVPVMPEVAKTETKEGLEAFVRHWYSTLSYAYETGDSQKLEQISGPNCLFCAGLIDGLTEAWADSRWISGGKIETPSISVTLEPDGEPYAVVQVVQEVIEIRNPDGSLYQAPTPATNTGSRAAAKFDATGWTLTDLGLIR